MKRTLFYSSIFFLCFSSAHSLFAAKPRLPNSARYCPRDPYINKKNSSKASCAQKGEEIRKCLRSDNPHSKECQKLLEAFAECSGSVDQNNSKS